MQLTKQVKNAGKAVKRYKTIQNRLDQTKSVVDNLRNYRKLYQEMEVSYRKIKTERDGVLCKVRGLEERARRAEREAAEAKTRAKQAEHQREKMKAKMDQALALCETLRGFRKQYHHMAVEYPKMQTERDGALRKVGSGRVQCCVQH